MIITSKHELQELVDEASQAPAVALDTEFVWERTFYPNLGLIQLAIGRECYFIDPVAIADMSALGQLLANPDVIKILHDAQQDLTILKNATGAVPANIFDTRLAYGFCSDTSILSLAALLERTIGINLAKTETRTNWLQRPLSSKQLEYAADDVKYLTEVMNLIIGQAEKQQTAAWLKDEMKRYDVPELYLEIEPQEYFRKIGNTERLNGRQLSILRELSTWREKIARKLNRPRGHIIHNKTLIDLVYSAPLRIEALKGINQLHPKAIERYGKSLIHCIETAIAVPAHQQPTVMPKFSQRTAIKLIITAIKHKAKSINIDPALLCSNKELNNILNSTLGASHTQPLFNGWRNEFMQDLYRNREIAALLGISKQ
jgi:ribonuclease D